MKKGKGGKENEHLRNVRRTRTLPTTITNVAFFFFFTSQVCRVIVCLMVYKTECLLYGKMYGTIGCVVMI